MAWHYFLAYGPWTDTITGENFVVCRCPATVTGRAAGPWSKKLMPKLHRQLKIWYGVKIRDWNVDSATADIWHNPLHIAYEWTGTDWVLVGEATRRIFVSP